MAAKVVVRKSGGGKLFRLRYDPSVAGGEVRLDGDFFLHPEEGLEALERHLRSCLGIAVEESAIRYLKGKLDEDKIQIIGADATDLISALWEARE